MTRRNINRVHLNFGSNIGDSRAIISRAVADVGLIDGVEIIAQSQFIESDPWGFESTNRFVNKGVLIETWLGPLELLDALQLVEQRIGATPHRNPDGSYRDRRLDIDIITFGNLHIESDRLTVPHPRMNERDFVTVPMREIDRMLAGGDRDPKE